MVGAPLWSAQSQAAMGKESRDREPSTVALASPAPRRQGALGGDNAEPSCGHADAVEAGTCSEHTLVEIAAERRHEEGGSAAKTSTVLQS